MKNNFYGFLLCTYVVLISSSVYAQTPSKDQKTAKEFLDYIVKEQYKQCIPLMDTVMTSKVREAGLEEIWDGITSRIGNYKAVKSVWNSKKDSFDIVHQITQFEKMDIDLYLTFNKRGLIEGFHMGSADTTKSAESYISPSYANKRAFTEQNITIQNGEYSLPGTLSIPIAGDKFPLVILVHGSGPGNRDEEIGPEQPFKDIAWGLASKRIAVCRYDKRTLVYGPKMANQAITVKEETIDDVIACVKLMKMNPSVDSTKIFIVGHSLGAMLAPRIAQSINGLAGIIMLAGNARPMQDLLVEQFMYLSENYKKGPKIDKAYIDNIRKQVEVINSPDLNLQTPSKDLPFNTPASYWIDLKKYDQVQTAKKLTLPIFILQGEKDYQVTMKDYNLWKENLSSKANVTMKLYPKLNHLFMEAPGEKSLPSDYEKAANVSEPVISDLANWINEH